MDSDQKQGDAEAVASEIKNNKKETAVVCWNGISAAVFSIYREIGKRKQKLDADESSFCVMLISMCQGMGVVSGSSDLTSGTQGIRKVLTYQSLQVLLIL